MFSWRISFTVFVHSYSAKRKRPSWVLRGPLSQARKLHSALSVIVSLASFSRGFLNLRSRSTDRLREGGTTRSVTPVFPCLRSSAKYEQFVDCVSKSMQICYNHQLSESQIGRIAYQSFRERTLCLDGIARIPTMPPESAGLPCSASFSSDAEACLRTFYEKFAIDKSDPSLCQLVTFI